MYAVTNHTAEFYLRWWSRRAFPHPDLPELHAALVMLAAGQGPARLPTCEQALQRVWIRSDPETDAVAPTVLLRLLSLFRPHEVRALRVLHVKAFTFVTSLLERTDAVGLGVSQALASLSVFECPRPFVLLSDPHITLVARHVATIRQLNCTVVRQDAPTTWEQVVARCTLLESLACAHALSSSVWLPMSHLHTLRGVDLGRVTIAAIAAALPRLHTLEASHSTLRSATPAAALAGFFESLLPRLQVFDFHGDWPIDDGDDAAMEAPHEPIRALPLEHLGLRLGRLHKPAARFVRLVQPVTLHIHYELIDLWLAAAATGWSPLARLVMLHTFSGSLRMQQVAEILRAAPQLQALTISNADVDAGWYSSLDATPPAFDGLRHRCLRHMHLIRERPIGEDIPVGCAARLQQRHFPRLVLIASDDRLQFATELDHEPQTK